MVTNSKDKSSRGKAHPKSTTPLKCGVIYGVYGKADAAKQYGVKMSKPPHTYI